MLSIWPLSPAPSKVTCDMGNPGGHEAIEQAVLVRGAQGEGPGGAFGMCGKDRPEIDGWKAAVVLPEWGSVWVMDISVR